MSVEYKWPTSSELTSADEIMKTSLQLNDNRFTTNYFGDIKQYRLVDGDLVTKFNLASLLKNAPRLADVSW